MALRPQDLLNLGMDPNQNQAPNPLAMGSLDRSPADVNGSLPQLPPKAPDLKPIGPIITPKEMEKHEKQFRTKQDTVTDTRLDPSEVNAYAQKLSGPGSIFEGQNQGIETQKEFLKAYLAQKPQVDLSPLMALADSLGKGSNLAGAYEGQRPISSAQQQSLVGGQLSKIASEQNAANQSVLKAFVDAKNGKQTNETQQRILDLYQKGDVRGGGGQEKNLDTFLINKAQTAHDTFEKRISDIHQISDVLNGGSYNEIKQNAYKMMSLINGEKGRIPYPEIMKILPEGFERSKAGLESWFDANAKMGAAGLQPVKNLLNHIKAQTLSATRENLDSQISTIKASPLYGARPVDQIFKPVKDLVAKEEEAALTPQQVAAKKYSEIDAKPQAERSPEEQAFVTQMDAIHSGAKK